MLMSISKQKKRWKNKDRQIREERMKAKVNETRKVRKKAREREQER